MSQALPEAGSAIGASIRGPITLEMLKLYAKASGDYNPIHTDEEVAKKAGLPGIIAHGMLTAGFLSDVAVRFMKPWEDSWKISAFQTRFKVMTFLGDHVTISGSVKSVNEKQICLEMKAINSKSEVTTQATVEFSPRS